MQSCLICDSDVARRDALAAMVSGRWPEARISLAADFPQSWALASAAPQLCLVDLMAAGSDERRGVAGIRAAAPNSRIVAITASLDEMLLLDLVEIGVDGLVPKACDPALMLAAIELVAAGGRYLPARVSHLATQRQTRGDARQINASPRQREVLLLISLGLSNKAIAKRLGLSPATVKTHVATALAALGAANRTEAAMKAMMAGLI